MGLGPTFTLGALRQGLSVSTRSTPPTWTTTRRRCGDLQADLDSGAITQEAYESQLEQWGLEPDATGGVGGIGGRVSAAPKGELKYVRRQKLAQSLFVRLPLGEVPRRGRRGQPTPGAHVRYFPSSMSTSEASVSPAGSGRSWTVPNWGPGPKARIDSGGTPPFGERRSLFP